jgi:predicted SnoaL-like aldol condensation-catalyzing enzyme
MSKGALACHPNQHFVLTSPIPIDRDIPRAFTHIPADYIQHNPFELDGITSSFDFLNPIFSNTSVTVQILHRVFEAPYGWLHYRVDGLLEEPTAIVDLFRFNGTCMQEHWDVIQGRPVNSTNPHPLF